MSDYKLPQSLINELNRDVFISLNEELAPAGLDAGYSPFVNLVSVDFDRLHGDGAPYDAAVREYVRIRDLLKAEKAGKDYRYTMIDREVREKMDAWQYGGTFFLLPESRLASFQEYSTPEFSDFCKANSVYYVVREDDHFHNLTTGDRFTIECEAVPGMADDAATYLEYSIHIIEEKEKYLDKIRGCIFGGAVGDALGYPVEFMNAADISAEFGEKGITAYCLSEDGKALISDDTQMSLFTATGVLQGYTQDCTQGTEEPPSTYVAMAYDNWLMTQEETYEQVQQKERGYGKSICSWLVDIPELYACRAPGFTCLNALEAERETKDKRYGKYMETPRNDSCGCGGVMRIAPFALFYKDYDIKEMDKEAAQIAAITHGNSLGYMPAAVLSHIIHRLLYGEDQKTLKEIVLEARDTVAEIFDVDRNKQALCDIIDLAVQLSENDADDLTNISRIGEGWVAEETLAIAIYCSLRHQDDFSAGIIAAVNHDGDSDSTGAVTGNILGVIHGYDAIEEKWKENLELDDIILEVADDISHGCQMSESGGYLVPAWISKYLDIRYPLWTCKYLDIRNHGKS